MIKWISRIGIALLIATASCNIENTEKTPTKKVIIDSTVLKQENQVPEPGTMHEEVHYFDIFDKEWKLVKLNNVEIRIPEGKKEMFIKFHHGENEDQFSAFGGCNQIRGPITLKNPDQFSIKDVVSTRMHCPEAEREQLFIKALRDVNTFKAEGDMLYLYGGDGDVMIFHLQTF